MSRYLSPVLSLLWVSIGVVIFLVSWNQLEEFPESVPVHWGLGGEADRYVPRSELFAHLIALPAIMVGLAAIALLLPWLSPKAFRVSIEQPAVGWIFSIVFLLFLFLQVILTLAMAEKLNGKTMEKILFGSIGLFFAMIGPPLAWVPRNFYVGIRTPWTIASEEVWQKTHVLGAWSFTIGGILAVLSSLLFSNFFIFLGILIISPLIPVVYSFWLSKNLESRPT